MNQSQFLAITSNSLKVREKSRVRGVIGFAFDSHTGIKSFSFFARRCALWDRK